MVDILLQNLGVVITIVLLLLVIIILYVLNCRKEAAKLALELIIVAEKAIVGCKKGDEKFRFVYENLYPKLPGIIKILFSEDELLNLINEMVNNMKMEIQEVILLSSD